MDNAMLDGTLGAGSGCLALVMIVVILAINAAASSKAKENRQQPGYEEAMRNPAYAVNEHAQGCIGWLLGIGAITVAAMILGGMLTVGGG